MAIDVFSANTLSVVVCFCCNKLCSICLIFVVSALMVSHLMVISCIADIQYFFQIALPFVTSLEDILSSNRLFKFVGL